MGRTSNPRDFETVGVCVPAEFARRVEKLAERWGCSKSEAARKCIKLGIEEIEWVHSELATPTGGILLALVELFVSDTEVEPVRELRRKIIDEKKRRAHPKLFGSPEIA